MVAVQLMLSVRRFPVLFITDPQVLEHLEEHRDVVVRQKVLLYLVEIDFFFASIL